MLDMLHGTATFIMPHFRTENEESKVHLDDAIDSLFDQTDENWELIIVDDASPCKEAVEYLYEIKNRAEDKIHLILNEQNLGAGPARNIGIQMAAERNSPFILYIDADDICTPNRLKEVRKKFIEDPEADLVYSTFKVIDEQNNLTKDEDLAPNVAEILEWHRKSAPEGDDIWEAMVLGTGYINLTSATAVKTKLACDFPFPNETSGEDSHTWYRYAAGGAKFLYIPKILSLYRVPANTGGISSMERAGGKSNFNRIATNVCTEGVKESLKILINRGRITPCVENDLLIRFYLRHGESLIRRGQLTVTTELLEKAAKISKSKTKLFLEKLRKKHTRNTNIQYIETMYELFHQKIA